MDSVTLDDIHRASNLAPDHLMCQIQAGLLSSKGPCKASGSGPLSVETQQPAAGCLALLTVPCCVQAAALLNGQPMGGKHRSAHRHDLWCIKYLPGFKWDHLTEEIGEKLRSHHRLPCLICLQEIGGLLSSSAAVLRSYLRSSSSGKPLTGAWGCSIPECCAGPEAGQRDLGGQARARLLHVSSGQGQGPGSSAGTQAQGVLGLSPGSCQLQMWTV